MNRFTIEHASSQLASKLVLFIATLAIGDICIPPCTPILNLRLNVSLLDCRVRIGSNLHLSA